MNRPNRKWQVKVDPDKLGTSRAEHLHGMDRCQFPAEGFQDASGGDAEDFSWPGHSAFKKRVKEPAAKTPVCRHNPVPAATKAWPATTSRK